MAWGVAVMPLYEYQVPNGSDAAKLRDYALRMVTPIRQTAESRTPLGEWVGEERNADRKQRNDALVALAEFIHGTITPGCGCEECYARRETVMALIYNPRIDAEALNRAIG